MPSKCYIVDYDNKINQYKQLLGQMARSQYSRDSAYKIPNFYRDDQHDLKNKLEEIDNYLDEMLQTPGMSDEDIYNLRKDQNDILEMTEEISDNLQNLEKNMNECCDDNSNAKVSSKNTIKDNNYHNADNKKQGMDLPPNITININSGEKKNSFYTQKKIDPQKIKI